MYIYIYYITLRTHTLWHYNIIISYGTKTTAQWTTFSFTTLVSRPGGCDGVTKYKHMTPRAQLLLLLFPNPFPSIAVRPPYRVVLRTDNIVRVHIIIIMYDIITSYGGTIAYEHEMLFIRRVPARWELFGTSAESFRFSSQNNVLTHCTKYYYIIMNIIIIIIYSYIILYSIYSGRRPSVVYEFTRSRSRRRWWLLVGNIHKGASRT